MLCYEISDYLRKGKCFLVYNAVMVCNRQTIACICFLFAYCSSLIPPSSRHHHHHHHLCECFFKVTQSYGDNFLFINYFSRTDVLFFPRINSSPPLPHLPMPWSCGCVISLSWHHEIPELNQVITISISRALSLQSPCSRLQESTRLVGFRWV